MALSSHDLLRQYRNQANLTQEELAQLAGLNGPRMLQSWEGGFSLPTAKRLRRLLEIFQAHHAFPAGQELNRAAQLWLAVKTDFESADSNMRGYPHFDPAWFMEKVLGERPMPEPVLPSKISSHQAEIPFVGREPDLASLKVTLVEKHARLISLCGPGGVGKTRLAQELKVVLNPYFKDGVHFISLEALDYPAYLAATIGQGLGVTLPENAVPLAELLNYLRDREILLILDNFEQLIGAAPQLEMLLASCAQLQILVTSREVLRLPSEEVYFLAPLPAPRSKTQEDLVNNPGILLFYAKAHQADPGFKLQNQSLAPIAGICQKLDNLPLAIELAASRVAVLSVEQILEHLNTSFKLLNSSRPTSYPARHQSLSQTLEWSYRLLEPPGQQLLARLALFRQDWTAETAEAIAGFDGLAVLDGLEYLVTRNLLVRRTDPQKPIRFRMLQVIREFALQKLAKQSGSEQAELNFIDYYLRLVEDIELKLWGENQKDLLARIEEEYPNIREALQRAISRQKGDQATRLCGALWLFWWMRGYIPEGRAFTDQALQLPSFSQSSPGKARALNAAGNLADIQGDLEAAKNYFQQSIAAFSEAGDKRGQSKAFNNLGNILSINGDYSLSQQYLEKALQLQTELDNPYMIAGTLNNLGRLARLTGDDSAGLRYYEQALHYMRQYGENWTLAQLLANLANLSLEMGNLNSAEQYAEECFELAKAQDYKNVQLIALQSLAEIAVERKNWAEATELYQAGLKLAAETGDRMNQAIMLNGLGRTQIELADIAAAHRTLVQSRKLFEALGSKEGKLLVMLNQALLTAKEGEIHRALRQVEVLKTLAQEWQTPLKPRALRDLDNIVNTI